MSGQKILSRFDRTQIRFFTGNLYPTLPGELYYILVQFFQGAAQLSLF